MRAVCMRLRLVQTVGEHGVYSKAPPQKTEHTDYKRQVGTMWGSSKTGSKINNVIDTGTVRLTYLTHKKEPKTVCVIIGTSPSTHHLYGQSLYIPAITSSCKQIQVILETHKPKDQLANTVYCAMSQAAHTHTSLVVVTAHN